MIPEAAITHWRNLAPWPHEAQVEQDLILCRALVEMFQESDVSTAAALRGGTALYKLFAADRLRYSEDIDLVQVAAGPIGPLMNAIRARLDPLLGKPRWEKGPGNVTLKYRMTSELPPRVSLRLKIEINTREHFSVFGLILRRLQVRSPWFQGEAEVRTYTLEELLGTKLRALYQRRKGRDLFDLWFGLRMKDVDPDRIVDAFRKYMEFEGGKVSRSEFEQNLSEKVAMRRFGEDLRPILAPGVPYDAAEAARQVSERLLSRL
jgi:predicted nucleotidyltransferase component of viral defense system